MIQMHEVESGDHLTVPGDFRIIQRAAGVQYPVIVCPGCVKPASCGNHTMLSRNPLTIRASFLCSCGWHGWVTEGTMVEWSATPSSVTLPSGAVLDPSTGKVNP
jgi:hypothetical protein